MCLRDRYCEGDMNKALSIATDLITANPDLKGFFTNNETTTIALATVLAEQGLKGEIIHVGFDATIQTADYLRDGTTAAIVTQVPYNMGYICLLYTSSTPLLMAFSISLTCPSKSVSEDIPSTVMFTL